MQGSDADTKALESRESVATAQTTAADSIATSRCASLDAQMTGVFDCPGILSADLSELAPNFPTRYPGYCLPTPS
jgi:hypothetical protein